MQPIRHTRSNKNISHYLWAETSLSCFYGLFVIILIDPKQACPFWVFFGSLEPGSVFISTHGSPITLAFVTFVFR